ALGTNSVCADLAVAWERSTPAARLVLDWDARLRRAGLEYVATGHAGNLLCLLSFVHLRGAGFFELPVRWNAARSGLHFFVLCPTWISARVGATAPSVSRLAVPAAMGMVPNLLSIWRGQIVEWRSRMATLHRYGRLLPERSFANLDRLVRATTAAQVSRFHRRRNIGHGTRIDLDDVLSPAVENRFIFPRHDLAGRGNPDRQLCVSQLSGAGHGHFAAG